MQGIYKYVTETIDASRVYTVTAILYLQFMLHVMLFLVLSVPYFCM